jgi:hypothetical protein
LIIIFLNNFFAIFSEFFRIFSLFFSDLMNVKERLTISCSKIDGRFVGRTVVDLSEFATKLNQPVKKTIYLKVLSGASPGRSGSRSPPRLLKAYSSSARHSSLLSVGGLFSSEPSAVEITVEIQINSKSSATSSCRRLQLNRILEQNKRLNVFPTEQHPLALTSWKWELPSDPASLFSSVLLVGKTNPFERWFTVILSFANDDL